MADRFAVSTFSRVFDVEPHRDLITIDELSRGLTRFILKEDLARSVERDVMRVEQAWEAYESGKRLGGRRWGVLIRGEKRAGKEGARQAYEKMLKNAKGRAKTDLRLWSPTLYEEGARRDSENVIHVSCIVLDFDEGASIEDAHRWFAPWRHILHTTWSHQPSAPKFRLALPLASPVPANDFRVLWEWAAKRAEHRLDESLKSPGSTYALPAVADRGRPRYAADIPGPLLDAQKACGVSAASPAPSEVRGEPTLFRKTADPKVHFSSESIVGHIPSDDAFDLFSSPADIEDEFDLF